VGRKLIPLYPVPETYLTADAPLKGGISGHNRKNICLSLLIRTVLYISFQPLVLFPDGVQHGFTASIAMEFLAQHDQPYSATMPLYGAVQAFALHREGPGILIVHAMGDQQWGLDLVRVIEGGHTPIDLWGLPKGPSFALETEGCQGTVIGSATSYTGGKKICVGQEIGGHERAIGMAAHPDPVPIDHPESIGNIIDKGDCVVLDLADKGIIGLGIPFPHDRHVGIVQYGIAPC